jgi:hypothetical protein
LNRLSEEQVKKVQNAGTRAAELDLPLSFEIHDEDPAAAGPRNLSFSDPLITADSVIIHQKCERPVVPKDPVTDPVFEK